MSRGRFVALGAGGLSAALIALGIPSQRNAFEVLAFSGLCSALLAVALHWWWRPIYNSFYDYFSPLAIVESLGFVYLCIGCIQAFYDHDSVIYPNAGAEHHYLLPLAASVVGLTAFDFAYRWASRRFLRPDAVHLGTLLGRAGSRWTNSWYERLARRKMFVFSAFWYGLTLLSFAHLTNRYIRIDRLLGGISSQLDNVLFQIGPGLLLTAWASLSLVLFSARRRMGQLVALGCLFSLGPFMFAYFSRTMALIAVVISGIAYVLTRPGQRIKLGSALAVLCVLVLGFVVVTGAKTAYVGDLRVQQAVGSQGVREGFVTTLQSSSFLDTARIGEALIRDATFRLDGLEFPAGIEARHADGGIPYMGGRHALLAASKAVPSLFWSDKAGQDPEAEVSRHFGLHVADQIVTLPGSAYADFGGAGVVAGLTVLGLVLAVAQHALWRFELGIVVYLGGLAYLFRFEEYLGAYLFMWGRFVALVAASALVISWVVDLLPTKARDVSSGRPALANV